jgi:hypothetical protein
VTSLAHWHFLKRLQGEILFNAVAGEAFLQNNDLISDLAEANQEVAVRGGGMDFLAQLSQSRAGSVEPFRR